jgi:hypothetical protein
MSDTTEFPTNMVRRGGVYYASVRIPGSLAFRYGKRTHLRRSLRTTRLEHARTLLPVVVGKLKADIERARRNPDGVRIVGRKAGDPVAEGLAWRWAIIESGCDPKDASDEARTEAYFRGSSARHHGTHPSRRRTRCYPSRP